MIKKALLVGINHYDNNDSNLNGCIKDVEMMTELLSFNYGERKGHNKANFECKSLKSNPVEFGNKITRTLLKREIKMLFNDPKADVVLFYFSGHGFESSLGGYLVTQDAKTYEEGVSFNDIITYANKSVNKEIIIILDCCRSGHFGKITIAKSHLSNIQEGISVLTASTAKQDSWDTSNGAVFTNLIGNALKGGSSDLTGNVKVTNLYQHAERMLGPWEQRPTLKMNTKNLVVLRKAEPKVKFELLQKITNYFPNQDYVFPLGPEFEPTEKTAQKEKAAVFADLQKLANNGLVQPVGEKYMYYAAIHSKSCKLTLVGKQYWELLHNKALIY